MSGSCRDFPHSRKLHTLIVVASWTGPHAVSAMASLLVADASTGQAHHTPDNPLDVPDAGDGAEGEVIEEPAGQRPGHG